MEVWDLVFVSAYLKQQPWSPVAVYTGLYLKSVFFSLALLGLIEGRLNEVVLITGFLIIKATQPEGSKTFDKVELAKTIFDTCVVYSIS